MEPVKERGEIEAIVKKLVDTKAGSTSITKQKLTVYKGVGTEGEWKEGTLFRNIKATLGIRGYRSLKDVAKMSLQLGVVDGEFINLLAESKSNRWYSSINPMTVGKKTLDVLRVSDTIIKGEEAYSKGTSVDFTQYLAELESITASQRADVVRIVAQNFSGLRVVSFRGCRDIVTNDMVKALAEHCQNLAEIDLYGCRKVSDEIKAELRRRPRMTVTDEGAGGPTQLEDPGNVPKAFSQKLPEGLSGKIIRGALENGTKVDFEPYLSELCKMGDSKKEKVVREVVQHLPHLANVSFNGCGNYITNGMVKALAEHCPSLTDINFSGCRNVGDRGVFALTSERCPQLRTVDLSSTDVTDNGAKHLSNLITLKNVSLKDCMCIGSETLEYFAEGAARLDTLNLSHDPVTIETANIEKMNHAPAQMIYAQKCEHLSQEAVKALKGRFTECTVLVSNMQGEAEQVL